MVVSAHDPQFGGFGRPPKFPLPSYLGFLLRYNARTGKGSALNPVVKTLDAMAAGGIHDHLAGGFHRYSTDRYWLVPHFEKMLYDNALLARVYADAYRVDPRGEVRPDGQGHPRLDPRRDDLPRGRLLLGGGRGHPRGRGLLLHLDALARSPSVLGKEDAAVFCDYYGVSPDGNFEGGRSILSVTTTPERTAAKLGLTAEQVDKALERGRRALLEARRKRNRPRVDDKVLASWNGLAISAFACAYQALQDETYLSAAKRGAEFVLSKLVRKGASPMLLRRYRDGDVAIEGNLEDYSFLDRRPPRPLRGLLRKEVDVRRDHARERDGRALFWDAERGAFFLTPPGREIVAIKEGYDGPTPSGNSVAALDLLRLAEFTGNQDFREMAETTLKLFADPMESTPTGYLEMLGAVDFSFGSKEVVVASGWGPGELGAMVREVQTRYLPTKVLAMADGDPAMAQLTEGKGSIKGMPTVYVCENFACKAPVTDVEALRRELDATPVGGGA